MSEHVVGPVDELPPGEGMTVTVDGLPVAVFNVDGELYAVSNRCAHKGGPIGAGTLHGELPHVDEDRLSVHCPWHYWEYDLETGRRVVTGEAGLRTFDARVEGGDIVVSV